MKSFQKYFVLVLTLPLLFSGCTTIQQQQNKPASHSSKTATKEFLEWEHKRAAESQVVAYATVNTNDAPTVILIVSEFWKGGDDAKSIGITNGMQFPMTWPTGQPLADGAVMFFPHDTDPSQAFLGGGAMFVRQCYVGDMPFQDFKTGLGL